MKVSIGDIELYYDIANKELVGDGTHLKQRPTLLLLHGGPGADHNYFKPAMSVLADEMQVVYLDQRGHGQSDRSVPEKWYLQQWADDISSFITRSKLEKVTVLGHSFGGFVAQLFALRHPTQLEKLILSSSMATFRMQRIIDAFGALYGTEAREAAVDFWNAPQEQTVRKRYRDICGPLYNTTPQDKDQASRIIRNDDVLVHFFSFNGEGRRFNFLNELKEMSVPVLVLAGERDPVSTPEDARELAAAMPQELVNLRLFKNCGHGVHRDDPVHAFEVIREFIKRPKLGLTLSSNSQNHSPNL